MWGYLWELVFVYRSQYVLIYLSICMACVVCLSVSVFSPHESQCVCLFPGFWVCLKVNISSCPGCVWCVCVRVLPCSPVSVSASDFRCECVMVCQGLCVWLWLRLPGVYPRACETPCVRVTEWWGP